MTASRAHPRGADTGTIPGTERSNDAARSLPSLSTPSLLRLMNAEDQRVASAVRREVPAIARAVDAVAQRVGSGGRLILVGAGTSGRLAVIEAAEVTPTFGVSGTVLAVMAGGPDAVTRPREGAEDEPDQGAADMERLDVRDGDAVVGISASGRTAFVLGAIEVARGRNALTIGLCCDQPTPLSDAVDLAIQPIVGPEVIAGSTRLKAGSAQKLVLNMLTTAVMVRLGRVHGNLMIDVQATNAKLRRRARSIVEQVTGRSGAPVEAALDAAGWSARVAIVMLARGVDAEESRRLLATGVPLDRLLDPRDDGARNG